MAQLKGNKPSLKTPADKRQSCMHARSGRNSIPAAEKRSTLKFCMKPNCSLNVHCGRLHSRDMPVVEVWNLASTVEMFVQWNRTNRKNAGYLFLWLQRPDPLWGQFVGK